MVPSPKSLDGDTRTLEQRLDNIEQHWKNALTLVHEGRPEAAMDAVLQAESDLLALGESGTATASPATVEKVHALERLRQELIDQSEQAREKVRRDLRSARRNTSKLKSYGTAQPRSALSEMC